MHSEIPSDNKDQSSFIFMKDVPSHERRFRVGVVGATGLVGLTLLRILKERSFPVRELHLFASSRSEGSWKETPFGTAPIISLSPGKIPELDLVFMAAGSSVARRWARTFARKGALVIDKSSYFRNKRYAPLVVPEVNPEALRTNQGIFANPNCTTIPVVMALTPLHRAFDLADFTAVSFQSVSGYGKEGLVSLERELEDTEIDATVFPHRIAHNVIPWIGENIKGSSEEEIKMIRETRRILEIPRLPVRVTSVRVPIRFGHSIAIHAHFKQPVNVSAAKEVLRDFDGIVVMDNPTEGEYPTPLDCAGRDEVFVGRIRRERGRHRLAFWVVTDNLRKGAATNAVQIAETLIHMDSRE